MQNLATKVRRWWITVQGPPPPLVPFEVACVCGQKAQGQRQAQYQVLQCSACGRRLFVLPLSAYPPVAAGNGAGAAVPLAAGHSRSSWLLPVIAATLTLALVVAVFVVVLTWLGHGTSRKEDVGPPLVAGQKALAEGDFLRAREHLGEACAIRDRHPNLLPPSESRELTQLYRQADLLANLLEKPLGEIILAAVGRPKEAWQGEFEHDYKGKAVVFEALVQQDPASGKFNVEYPIFAANESVQLEFGDLELFRHVPSLAEPQLLLFGARLASIQRDQAGGWVIHFQPDSGVFLTDPGAAARCCDRPLEEPLQAVLHKQAQWVRDTP